MILHSEGAQETEESINLIIREILKLGVKIIITPFP